MLEKLQAYGLSLVFPLFLLMGLLYSIECTGGARYFLTGSYLFDRRTIV